MSSRRCALLLCAASSCRLEHEATRPPAEPCCRTGQQQSGTVHVLAQPCVSWQARACRVSAGRLMQQPEWQMQAPKGPETVHGDRGMPHAPAHLPGVEGRVEVPQGHQLRHDPHLQGGGGAVRIKGNSIEQTNNLKNGVLELINSKSSAFPRLPAWRCMHTGRCTAVHGPSRHPSMMQEPHSSPGAVWKPGLLFPLPQTRPHGSPQSPGMIGLAASQRKRLCSSLAQRSKAQAHACNHPALTLNPQPSTLNPKPSCRGRAHVSGRLHCAPCNQVGVSCEASHPALPQQAPKNCTMLGLWHPW